MLNKIDLSHIKYKRPSECSSIEIFYTMFIRALMTKKQKIIIVTPHMLIHNLKEISSILKKLELLNKTKNIIILDILSHETHYMDAKCNIEK
jgi:hypothetical protein